MHLLIVSKIFLHLLSSLIHVFVRLIVPILLLKGIPHYISVVGGSIFEFFDIASKLLELSKVGESVGLPNVFSTIEVHQGKIELNSFIRSRLWSIVILERRNRLPIHVVCFDGGKNNEPDVFLVGVALEQMNGSLQGSFERRNKNGLEVNLVRDRLLALCLLDPFCMETDILDLWLTIEPFVLVGSVSKL